MLSIRKGIIYMIKRQETIYLKSIAIILVIGEHVLGSFCGFENGHILNLMGTGAVCLFLVLSGYGTYVSYSGGIELKDYWNKKIDKIFLPYWIVTLLYVFCFMRSLPVIIIMKNLLCIDYDRNIDGTMWYMSFLLLFYAAFYIIFKFKIEDPVKILFLTLFGLCLNDLAAQGTFKACSWQFCNNYLAFPSGVFLGWISKFTFPKKIIQTGKLLKILLLALSVILYYLILRFDKDAFGILGIALSLGCIMLVSLISPYLQNIKVDIFKVTGKYSYILYLLEGKFISITGACIPYDNYIIKICVFLIFLVGFSCVFSRLLSLRRAITYHSANN